MSLQVKFPFGRGHGPLHTCGNCGFMTRHRAMYDRHLKRCSSTKTPQTTSERRPSTSPSPPLPSPPVCRNYRCEKCGFTTSRSKIYLHHRRESHGENFSIYPCDMCEYASRHKSKVIRHRGLVHKDAPEDPDFPQEMDAVSDVGVADEGVDETLGLGQSVFPEMREIGSAVYQAGINVAKNENDGEDDEDDEDEEMVPDENQNTPTKKRRIYVEHDTVENNVNKNYVSTFSSPEDPDNSPTATRIPDPTENPYDYITSRLDDTCSVSYRCRLCIYSNIHKWKVATHVRSVHMRKTLFKCPLCEFVTERKIEWCVHKTTHTEKLVHACKECSYRTTMKRNFERHLAHHRMQGGFKCNKCSYSTSGEAAVQRHMAEYHPSPDKQLAMDTIHYSPISAARRGTSSVPARSQSATGGSSVVRQRANNVPKQPSSATTGAEVQCNMCYVWFKNETRLRIHMVSHSNEAPHGCPICNLRYKRPADLNRHMKRKHGTRIDDGKPVLSAPEQDQPLDLCVKKSDEEDDDDQGVSDGEASATGDQPLDLSLKTPAELSQWRPHELKCSHCSYMAKWPSDLRRHMLVHSIEKRFRCPQCNKKYKYQFDLNMHMRKMHRIQSGKTRVSSAAAFSSPLVNKTAIKQEILEPIEKEVQPSMTRGSSKDSQILISTFYSDSSSVKDNLKCSYCDYVGKYPAEVERHTKLHTGPKPYLCLFCEYRSYWKSDIKRHLVKHHGTEVEKYGELPELVNLCYKPEENAEDEENLEDDDAMEEGEDGDEDYDEISEGKMDTNEEVEQAQGAVAGDMSEYAVDVGDRKVYQCPKCNLQYEFPSKLKNHLEVHDNIKKFLCPHCGKRSNWQWDIRKHIINVHPEMSTEVIILTEIEARETIEEYLRTRQPSPPKTTVEGGDDPKASEALDNVQGLDDYARVMNIDTVEDDDQEEEPVAKKPHSLLDSIPGGVDSLNLKGNNVNTLIATVAAGRYRKFKCSKCGKRSNWKWDIKKHIRSNHASATVIEMSEQEAKETFHEILTVKPKEAPVIQAPVASTSIANNTSTAGRKPGPLSPARSKYRPFKCTYCGKRSNWKWDLKKHLMKCDRKAQMIILSEEVAKATFDDECKIVPTNSRKSLPEPVTPTKTTPPDEIPSESPSPKVKKFKCSICPYRSDYRSDISRHLKRKHRRIRGKILVLGTDYAASTLTEYKERWVKKKFVISAEKVSELQEEQEVNGIPELDQCVRVVDVDPESDDEIDENNVEEERIYSSPEPTEFSVPVTTPPSHSLDFSLSHNKLWQCTKCEFQSRNKMTVIDHFRSHRQGRPFKCNVCGYTSDYRGSIYRHVKQKHKRKDYQDVITYVALREVPMDSKHTTPRLTPSPKEETNQVVDPKCLVKTFQCQLCPSKTIHKHNLIRHIKEKHPEIANPHQSFDEVMVYAVKSNSIGASKAKTNPPLKVDGTRTLRCDLCPFQTVKTGLLKIHQQYHVPKSGDHLRCKYCPYYVCTMQRLLRHMRLHVKEQNAGDVFDFEEESHANITSTTNTSTTLRPAGKARHFCDKCPYISINKNDFIYHKQFHRPKPTAPYKCDFCPYWVSLRRLLTQHQKVHSVEYKLQYYPKDVLMRDKSITLPGATQPSPTKSEMSIYSVDASDVVEVAQLKQQIISSKVTSVPITPQKLRTSNLLDCTDDNLMKGYIVDSTGHIMGNKSYQKLYQCKFCPYQNVRSTNLRLHERMHGRARHDDKELYQCQYCDYQVGNKGLLAQHVIVHSSRYQPGISEINDVEAMNEDGEFLMEKSSEDGDNEEDQDQKNNNIAHVFPQRVTIKTDPSEQIDVTHLPGSSDFYIKYDAADGKPFLEKALLRKWGCDRCPYATLKKVQFERHVMLHGCKQRYQCEFCDYSVPGYHLLVQHKKLHLMPNPNLLNVQSISNLQRLPEVPADFAAAANVPKNGEINKYGVHDSLPMYENSKEFTEPKKLYRCDRCPYTNVRRDHLLSHLKFHMINSDLRCPYCDYSVSKVHLLNQHVKVHFNTPGTEMSAERKEEEKSETPDFFTALKLQQKVRTEPEITIESIEREARQTLALQQNRALSEVESQAPKPTAITKDGAEHTSSCTSETKPHPKPMEIPVQEQPLSLTMTSPKLDAVGQLPDLDARDNDDDFDMPKLLIIDTTDSNSISKELAMEVDNDEGHASAGITSNTARDSAEEVAKDVAQDLSQKSSSHPEISTDVHPLPVSTPPTPKLWDEDSYAQRSPAAAHTDSPRRSTKVAEFRCRYCDRIFPSMHKMLLHEEQHLLGERH